MVFDIERFVVIFRINDYGQDEALRVRARESGIPIHVPLHGRSDAVAVAQVHVVAHTDFIAVVKDGCTRQRKEKAGQELHLASTVAYERGKSSANPKVDSHGRLIGVCAVHVVAFFVGHHLQGELVMVAQEESPLAGRVNLGRLGENIDDWESILLVNGHEHPRHQREVEVHVALVALTEIGRSVFRPLVGLGQKEAVLELRVDVGA